MVSMACAERISCLFSKALLKALLQNGALY